MYVVGTEEILTKQGHLLIVGIPSYENIQKDTRTLSLEDALKSADDINGIKIAVHPFGLSGIGEYFANPNYRELFRKLDGWEVYNSSAELAIPGFLPFNANEKSIQFYSFGTLKYSGIGACAFTDGHSAEVVGKSYTELYPEKEVSVDSLRDAIKENTAYRTLHMEPIKWDAFKHAVKMFAHKYFHTGD